MGQAQVVLFDLDGTLTDSKVGITRSIQFVLESFGIGGVADLDSLTPYIGPPLHDSFTLVSGLSAADATVAVARYREHFAHAGIFESQLYDGIPECLDALLTRGYRLAVATSKLTAFAERILNRFSVRSAFEVVVGAELDGTRIHKCDTISDALDKLDVPASRSCVMVGDREHDVIAARTVGIGSIGAMWGFGSRAELEAAGADLLIDEVAAVPDAVELVRSLGRVK